MSRHADVLQIDIASRGGLAPLPRDVSSAIRSLLQTGISLDRLSATDSILVLADGLASARALDFGRRLDCGERVTARSSVDLEVSESIRSINRLELGWDGRIWVCTGPAPGHWIRGVDHILEIETSQAIRNESQRWTATLRPSGPSSEGHEDPLHIEGDLNVLQCVVRSAIASDFDGHRSVFTAQSRQKLLSSSWGPNRDWVGSISLPLNSKKSQAEYLRSAVQSVVDSVRPDFSRLVILGAGQYSARLSDASANAGFAVPRELSIQDPASGRVICVPVLALSHACASTLYALDLARVVLRDPSVDTVIVASTNVQSVAATKSLAAVRALTDNQAKPFAADRDGITLGLGGGALCVERADGMHRTDVLGRITATSTRVAARAAASQSPAEVLAVLKELPACPDVVIAHATGTPVGDRVEIEAINAWIGAQKPQAPVPVISHKGTSGHLLHASGVLGVAHALSLLGQSSLAGTAGLLTDIELDSTTVLSQGGPRLTSTPISVVVVNALGFGGNTAALTIVSPT